MKFLPILLLASTSIMAQNAEPTILNLWPGQAPGETGDVPKEALTPADKNGVSRIKNVSVPTIELRKTKKATDAPTPAVLVAPGGGYGILAWEHEGTMVADWLNELGITAILLKYRVPRRKDRPKHEAPMQDAQRALRLVRANANAWNIDPNQLGMLGFSAGGHLTAITGTNPEQATYKPIDEHDALSARPDFLVLVYAAYLIDKASKELLPEITVDKNTPPTFSVVTHDDADRGIAAAQFYIACKKHNVPATTHIYLKGGHGYGMFDRGQPVHHWPKDVEDWFGSLGILKK